MFERENGSEICSEYVQSLIRAKTRQMLRRPEFRRTDPDEIQQSFTLYLLSRLNDFDATRASFHTFASRVIDSKVMAMIRECWQLRNSSPGRSVASLQMTVEQGHEGSAPLADCISQADLDRRTGNSSQKSQEQFEQSESLRSLLSQLPPELRDVCEARMLMNSKETQAYLKLSRRRFDALMQQIREHFEMGGFE